MTEAIVFFDNDWNSPLARFLKPGFRHCFCAVKSGGFWIMLQGCDGRPHPYILCSANIDPTELFADKISVCVTIGPALRSPVLWHSCISMVKAVCGIRSFAVTPYGLFKHLMRQANGD